MFDRKWARRSFLKASLLATLAVFSGNAAWARILTEDRFSEGRLSLLNIHTEEKLDVTFRNSAGRYDPGALDAINWLLRCHYTGEVHDIDLRTLEILNLVNRKLGGSHEIQVISGYRSPEYNELLREEGRHVAKHSLHMQGKAIDISIPGIRLSELRRTALNLRLGGVGYYPKTGFVHLDSGDFRTW